MMLHNCQRAFHIHIQLSQFMVLGGVTKEHTLEVRPCSLDDGTHVKKSLLRDFFEEYAVNRFAEVLDRICRNDVG